MSTTIDYERRQLIKAGVVGAVTILLGKHAASDQIADLVSEDNKIIAVRLWPSSLYTRLTIESVAPLLATQQLNLAKKQLIVTIKHAQATELLANLKEKILVTDPIIQDISVAIDDNIIITIMLKQAILVQPRVIEPVSLDNVSYKYRYVLDMYPDTTVNQDPSLNDDLLALLQLKQSHEKNVTSDNTANDDMVDMLAFTVNTESNARVIANKKASTSQNATKSFAPLASIAENASLSQRKSLKRKITVMLDPGHGGEDPGAIGKMGTMEKHVVLDIAKRLQKLLNQNQQFQAYLTRSDDVFIPLGSRVAMARRAKADVFISIHADAFITPNAKGSSVFILSDKGASSSFAKWLAKTQNNADLIGGMSFKSRDKSVNKLLLDMTQTWTRSKSDSLAKIMLGNLKDIGQLHNGHVEKAGFAVLKAPDIPSILVETAFISNPFEESRLKTSKFRQALAQSVFNGVSRFALHNLS